MPHIQVDCQLSVHSDLNIAIIATYLKLDVLVVGYNESLLFFQLFCDYLTCKDLPIFLYYYNHMYNYYAICDGILSYLSCYVL